MALENIVGTETVHRRWMIAFGFGLVHGFGFSFALRQSLQFAGAHMLTSLLSFNVGVELGQLLVLVILIPALELLFRHVVAEHCFSGIRAGDTHRLAPGWWSVGKCSARYRIQWPTLNAAFLVRDALDDGHCIYRRRVLVVYQRVARPQRKIQSLGHLSDTPRGIACPD